VAVVYTLTQVAILANSVTLPVLPVTKLLHSVQAVWQVVQHRCFYKVCNVWQRVKLGRMAMLPLPPVLLVYRLV
jgi:hypothetical protein